MQKYAMDNEIAVGTLIWNEINKTWGTIVKWSKIVGITYACLSMGSTTKKLLRFYT